jgi:hypothetical protein
MKKALIVCSFIFCASNFMRAGGMDLDSHEHKAPRPGPLITNSNTNINTTPVEKKKPIEEKIEEKKEEQQQGLFGYSHRTLGIGAMLTIAAILIFVNSRSTTKSDNTST